MRGPTMIRAVAPSNRSGWGGSVKKMLLGLVAGIFTLPALGLGSAKMDEGPESFKLPDQSLNQIDRRVLKDIDRASLLAQDGDRTRSPQRPGPLGFAVSEEVEFNLESSGTWQDLPAGRAWRLVIHAPEAVSLNLGIVRYDMPEGAKLWVYDPARKHVEGPYLARHRSRHGRLWTPIIEGDAIVVEIFVPTGISMPAITIGVVNKGYRALGKGAGDKSRGGCGNERVCPDGIAWRDPNQLFAHQDGQELPREQKRRSNHFTIGRAWEGELS